MTQFTLKQIVEFYAKKKCDALGVEWKDEYLNDLANEASRYYQLYIHRDIPSGYHISKVMMMISDWRIEQEAV